jgi:AcrR family transcriptional regulator
MAKNLRDHLIATAARLIGQRGGAGIGVRDIAREAQVAEGVLYTYFADKEDLLAQALLAHVAAVMQGLPGMAEPGTGTVAGNLASFIETGMASLGQVAPAFAGMAAQPGVLTRFHAMVGGDAAFGTSADGTDGDERGQSLPARLTRYLRAEQRLGRVDAGADIGAAVILIVGVIHGQVLPGVLLRSPGAPAAAPPGQALRLAGTVLTGIAPPG